MSVQRDIDAELRFHFDSHIDELMRQGMSHTEARARAIAEFGDVDAVRDGLHAIDRRVAKRRNRAEMIDALIQDVRYAARSLRRTPAVSLTIILTLALGIGVNAAMMSLLDVIYLRPPTGVHAANELRRMWIERRYRTGPEYSLVSDYTTFEAVRDATHGAADVTIYQPPRLRTIGRGENTPTLKLSPAQASYFRVLGVKAARGRLYTEEEATPGSSAMVMVISDALWTRQFARDPDIIGKTVTLGTLQYNIVGVTPPGFVGIDLDVADAWTPLESARPRPTRPPKVPWWRNPNENGLFVVARRHAGVSDAVLAQQITATVRQPREGSGYLDTLSVAGLGAVNIARGPGKTSGSLQVAVRLAGVAVIVLIIACANVVNLLLARAANRRREIAVRLALGISRPRLIRLLVTESVLLAAAGCVAALVAAQWGVALLQKLLLPEIQWAGTTLHWRLLLVALLATIATGVITGLIPALQSSSPDLANSLRSGTRQSGTQRSRLRSTLVVVQTALSVVLLVGSVLFIRSVQNVMAHDFGYAVDGLSFATVSYETRDSVRDAAVPSRLRALDDQIRAIPGVTHVAYASERPTYSIYSTMYFPDADTISHKRPVGIFSVVSTNYFETSGMRIVRGTTFPDERAAKGAPSVVINRATADGLWPKEDPLGRCIRFNTPTDPCTTVVGVVEVGILTHIDEKPQPHMYLSIDNSPVTRLNASSLVLRIDQQRATAVQSSVMQLLRAQFPGAVPKITSMAETMAPEYRPWTLGAKLFTAFGVLALVVAGIGVYSTVSYGVTQRTHEFGVRMALGARSEDVMRQVLGEGVRVMLVGIGVGVVLALAGGRLIASLLYGVEPGDPFALITVAVVLLCVALLAAFRPAFRASRFDPVAALRAE